MMRVSAIMSIYKEPVQLLERSINSVLNQTYQSWELLVTIDNPGNFEAISYIEGLSKLDSRISYVVNQKNLGLGACKNNAIKIANGEFIASQDADDISLPNRFQKQVNFLDNNPEVAMVGTALVYRDLESQANIFTRIFPRIIDTEINKRTPCGHPSIMARKDTFFKFGFYDTITVFANGEQAFCEDYDLWLRWYIAKVKIVNIEEPLIIYMRDLTKVGKAKAALKSVISIKKKYLPQLSFSISDYLYLYGQQIFSMMPSSMISKLFFISNKLKEKIS